MRDVLTVTVVLAGLFFSISCALLVEELMFGLFFRALAPGRRGKFPTLSREKRAGQGWGKGIPSSDKHEWAIPISQQRHEEGGVSCSH